MKLTISSKNYTAHLSDITLDAFIRWGDYSVRVGLGANFLLIDETGKSEILTTETSYVLTKTFLPLDEIYSVINKTLQKSFSEKGLICETTWLGGTYSDTYSITFKGGMTNKVESLTQLCHPQYLDGSQKTDAEKNERIKYLWEHREEVDRLDNEAKMFRERIFKVPDVGWSTLTEQDAANLYEILNKNDWIKPGWSQQDFVNKVAFLNHVTMEQYITGKCVFKPQESKKSESVSLATVSAVTKSPIHASSEKKEINVEKKPAVEKSKMVKFSI